MHKHARQQLALGIGEHCAERDRTGALIDRHFGKQQLARRRVLGAIVEDQLDRGLVRVSTLQLAVGQLALQAEDLGGGLGDVHVDRVELLHGRERGGLVGGHQRALGHRGASDAAGNRRQYFGVDQIDARGLDRRLG